MEIHRLFAVAGALALGTMTLTPTTAYAANHPAEAEAAQSANVGNPVIVEHVLATDAEVQAIERAIPNLKRHEVLPQPNSLAAVTDVQWAKLHTYAKGDVVQRLKVYPPAGSQKTEKFYYRDGTLVMVLIEPNGEGHKGHDDRANDERYYFDASGLIAIKGDGHVDGNPDEQAKAHGAKLQRESSAFLSLASSQESGKN